MRYDSKNLYINGIEWNKNSPKEILRYAIGSLLYTPATRVNISESICNKTLKNLKSIALCLEDSIMDNYESAEQILSDTIFKIHKDLTANRISINDLPLIFIRVRSPEQMERVFNNLIDCSEVVTGFILPKFSSENTTAYIDVFEKILTQTDNIYIMPILESGKVINIETRIEELIDIKNALKNVFDHVLNIRVGGNDFCNYYGFRRGIVNTIYDINVVAGVLSDIMNVFGRDYTISAAVWEYFEHEKDKTDWIIGLKSELKLDKLNGFIGKTCIHPSQMSIIQQSMIVSYHDYNDAIKILNWSDNDLGVQKGSEGRMNEVKSHTRWAEKTINLAKLYGVENL